MGKPSTHGRPDPKPEGEINEVGALDQKGEPPMVNRESDQRILL